MTRFFSILFSFLLIPALPGGSGIAADHAPDESRPGSASPADKREKALALFISAMLEKSPEKQCFRLLDVVESDPDNGETPLAAFSAAVEKVRNRQKILNRFNALWEKFPDNPLIACHGAELNRLCGTPAPERLRQLRKLLALPAPQLTASPAWHRRHTLAFLRNAADALMKSRDWDGLLKLFRNWTQAAPSHRLQALSLLAEACHTAAARSYCAGDEKTARELEQCFERSIAGLKELEPSVTSARDAMMILLLYSNYRRVLGPEVLRFAKVFHERVPGARSGTLLMSAAVECGDVKLFDACAEEMVRQNPRFDASELRFKTLLSAGKYADAESELKRLPEKYHFELRRLMLFKKKDWQGVHKLVSAYLAGGGIPTPTIGLVMLSVSEKLGDKEIYRRAKKLLLPQTGIPAVANAVGYVGATLDLDLAEGTELLKYALKKEPENAAFMDSMAWIAYKRKNFIEAEKWISEALRNVNPREGISVILEHAGDIAAALKKDPRPYYRLSLKYGVMDEEFDPENVSGKLKRLR